MPTRRYTPASAASDSDSLFDSETSSVESDTRSRQRRNDGARRSSGGRRSRRRDERYHSLGEVSPQQPLLDDGSDVRSGADREKDGDGTTAKPKKKSYTCCIVVGGVIFAVFVGLAIFVVVKKDALANLVNGKGFVENDAVLQSSTPATDDTLLPIETAPLGTAGTATAVSTPTSNLTGPVTTSTGNSTSTPTSATAKSSSTGSLSSGKGAVVAFGASYTDNAHPREAKYAESLRQYAPYDKYGGRYSNGPVAVEYLVNASLSSTKPTLHDYAYGGSVIKNGLEGTSSNYPAAEDQIALYLKDLESGDITIEGQVLYYFNSGINAVAQIWGNAMSKGLSSEASTSAKSAITANTKAMAAAIQTIVSSDVASAKTSKFSMLLAGIPPLEIVPTYGFQITNDYKMEDKKDQAVALLKTLSTQFNTEISAVADTLNADMAATAKFFDMSAFFYDMHKTPSKYKLTASPITTPCYDSSTGKVCDDPKVFLYFDTRHPTTYVHGILGAAALTGIKPEDISMD